MIKHQTLKVSIPANEIESYISILCNQAENLNYKRLLEMENSIILDNVLDCRYICLQTPRLHLDNQYLEATLWLSIESNSLILRNITSNQRTFLSVDEYNMILNTFYHNVVRKAKLKGVRRSLSKPVFNLRDVMGEKCVDALVKFSNSSNKDSELVHETDFMLWAKFVKLAHTTHARLTSVQLETWLREEGWRDKYAEKIASYYDYTLELMKYV